MDVFMILFIKVEELTTISLIWTVLGLFGFFRGGWLKVNDENSSSHYRLSVSDLSPAHGESQDEVLRRRHGDKEVRVTIFINPHDQCLV